MQFSPQALIAATLLLASSVLGCVRLQTQVISYHQKTEILGVLVNYAYLTDDGTGDIRCTGPKDPGARRTLANASIPWEFDCSASGDSLIMDVIGDTWNSPSRVVTYIPNGGNSQTYTAYNDQTIDPDVWQAQIGC